MSPRPTVIALTLALAMATGAEASERAEAMPAEAAPAEDARVIELEMVGVGRFLFDGEEVRVLQVVPGESVRFRVENTSGRELGFAVGTEERLCNPERSPRHAIPAWTEGTRELRWKVPARVRSQRWGHRGRHCSLGEFSARSDATEVGTAEQPVLVGPLDVHLARSRLWLSFDADFEGTTSAVAWREPWGDPWRALYLSRADDVALVDFTSERIAIDVDDHAVAVCGPDVVVAYLQRAPDDDRRLWLARLPGDGRPAARVEVRGLVEGGDYLDVACNDAGAFVAWSERIDGEWHPFVRHASLPGLELSTTFDAGPAKGKTVAIAATDDHGLLAWKRGQPIGLTHLQVLPDGGELAAVSTRTVTRLGREPILDADGRRVALAFVRGNRGVVLTSRDGGVRFDQEQRFGRKTMSGTPREFDSIAIRGGDVVATMVVYYGGDAWDRHRLRSHDRGKTWTTRRIGDPAAAIPRDGFLVTPRGVKVAEAYMDGEYASKHDLRVRRER